MNKSLLLGLVIAAICLAAHFIPVYNRVGFIERGSADVCIGYSSANRYDKHILFHGFKPPAGFTSNKEAVQGSGFTCAEPVDLRYYLL